MRRKWFDQYNAQMLLQCYEDRFREKPPLHRSECTMNMIRAARLGRSPQHKHVLISRELVQLVLTMILKPQSACTILSMRVFWPLLTIAAILSTVANDTASSMATSANTQ